MATVVELVRTPGILQPCVWYRVGCWSCGEYEICLSEHDPAPMRCRFCRAAVETMAVVKGRTARILPDVSKPRTQATAAEAGSWMYAKQPPKRKKRAGSGRPKTYQEAEVES